MVWTSPHQACCNAPVPQLPGWLKLPISLVGMLLPFAWVCCLPNCSAKYFFPGLIFVLVISSPWRGHGLFFSVWIQDEDAEQDDDSDVSGDVLDLGDICDAPPDPAPVAKPAASSPGAALEPASKSKAAAKRRSKGKAKPKCQTPTHVNPANIYVPSGSEAESESD